MVVDRSVLKISGQRNPRRDLGENVRTREDGTPVQAPDGRCLRWASVVAVDEGGLEKNVVFFSRGEE